MGPCTFGCTVAHLGSMRQPAPVSDIRLSLSLAPPERKGETGRKEEGFGGISMVVER